MPAVADMDHMAAEGRCQRGVGIAGEHKLFAPGDLVALFLAGAYGASASPAAFLGHEPAAEMLVGDD